MAGLFALSRGVDIKGWLGTEGEAGNLEERKGPVAEKVYTRGPTLRSACLRCWRVVVVVFKGRKRDKIRFQDFYPPPPAPMTESFSRAGRQAGPGYFLNF